MSRVRPVDLTPEQRGLIERKITEFVRGEAYEDCRKAAAAAHALPLCLDWTACMALRPDGQIIWIDYEEPHRVRLVEDERERNLGFFQGSRRDPDLGFLVPARPPDAIECPDCKGMGRLTFQKGYEQLAETIVCSCGGLGWLPSEFGNIGLSFLGWLRSGRRRSRKSAEP